MPFPNYPNKYQGRPVMLPADTITMRRRFGQFPDIEPPHAMILCMKNDLPQKLRWKHPINKVGRVMGDMYLVRRTHGRVGVLSNFGIGAPVVVSLAEEMIAFGVKRFIILSWGGALQKELNTGDVVINDKAVRDEGVSQHYLPNEKYALASQPLKQKLESYFISHKLQFVNGPTWTTDAPYRETSEEVAQYQSEGVQTVEMEVAGLFALAQLRNVQAASVVIVADRLANLEWEFPNNMNAINQAFEIAYGAVIDVLNEAE